MAERAAFQDLQREFAAHLRDPDHIAAPEGIEDRRLNIYRKLFFNNMVSLLASTFPVLSKIMGPDQWRRLIRQYFSKHVSHTPYFLQVPKEFIGYLEDEHEADKDDPPFLLELAHYEWVELALRIETIEADLTGIDRDGDLLEGHPVLSPLAWILAYQYPVHRISPDFRPTEKGDQTTFLVVCRDQSDKVGFIEINAVTACLLQKLQDPDAESAALSGHALLDTIAAEIGHPNPKTVVDGGRAILDQLRERDVILGTRPV